MVITSRFAWFSRSWLAVFLGASLVLAGCGGEDGDDDDKGEKGDDGSEVEQPGATNVTIITSSPEGICNLAAGPFSATIDNPWFALPAGQVAELRGEEDGAKVYLRMTVKDETLDVAGVSTRVLEEYEENDGEIVEISQNYFAQAADGSVCYFGEDVDIYENGKVTAHDGAWRAGDGVNQPGIQMPAKPVVGLSYAQEVAPGLAEDHADHIAAGEQTDTPYGTFDDTLRVREWSTLEPDDVSMKVYAYGVGLIVDDGLSLETLQ
jgi:hypothetical protein